MLRRTPATTGTHGRGTGQSKCLLFTALIYYLASLNIINVPKCTRNCVLCFYEKRLYSTRNISVECKTGNLLQPYNSVMYRSTVRPFITNFAATALTETGTDCYKGTGELRQRWANK